MLQLICSLLLRVAEFTLYFKDARRCSNNIRHDIVALNAPSVFMSLLKQLVFMMMSYYCHTREGTFVQWWEKLSRLYLYKHNNNQILFVYTVGGSNDNYSKDTSGQELNRPFNHISSSLQSVHNKWNSPNEDIKLMESVDVFWCALTLWYQSTSLPVKWPCFWIHGWWHTKGISWFSNSLYCHWFKIKTCYWWRNVMLSCFLSDEMLGWWLIQKHLFGCRFAFYLSLENIQAQNCARRFCFSLWVCCYIF